MKIVIIIFVLCSSVYAQETGDLFIKGSLFSADSNASLGGSNNTFKSIYADEAHFSSNTIYLGDTRLGITSNQLVLTEKDNPDIKVGLKAKKLEVDIGFVTKGRGKANNADFEVEGSDYGLIFTTTNGNRYVLQIDGSGNLFTTIISESPEVPINIRRQRMSTKRNTANIAKKQFKNAQNGQLQQRVEALEAMVKAYFNGLD